MPVASCPDLRGAAEIGGLEAVEQHAARERDELVVAGAREIEHPQQATRDGATSRRSASSCSASVRSRGLRTSPLSQSTSRLGAGEHAGGEPARDALAAFAVLERLVDPRDADLGGAALAELAPRGLADVFVLVLVGEARIVEQRHVVRRRHRHARSLEQPADRVERVLAARRGVDEGRRVDLLGRERLRELVQGPRRGVDAEQTAQRRQTELLRRHRLEPRRRELLHRAIVDGEELDELADRQIGRVRRAVREGVRARRLRRRAQESDDDVVQAELAQLRLMQRRAVLE